MNTFMGYTPDYHPIYVDLPGSYTMTSMADPNVAPDAIITSEFNLFGIGRNVLVLGIVGVLVAAAIVYSASKKR